MKPTSLKFFRWSALTIVAVQTALLGWGAVRQSPTYNEVAHLVAGVSYWQFGRFDVYRVDPPLTRLVAALPVVAAQPRTDWKVFDEGARPEFELAKDFVAANGERSLWLYTIARWACIPFSWLGAWICFRWGRELYGSTAGLLALSIWCFEPNILAHAQLVTPDAGATAFGLAASYCFWTWLRKPNCSHAAIAGLVLGLAELTKFTWLVLFLVWPAIWMLCRVRVDFRRTVLRARALEAVQLFLILFPMAICVINLGYGFEGSFQPLRKFQFVSEALADTETTEGRTVAQPGTNRLAKTWFGDLPVPLPRNFVIGLDLQKKDLEHFSRQSYLHGQFQGRGWWYFYLYGLAIKTPLGLWLLSILIIGAMAFCRRGATAPDWRDVLALLAPAIVILLLVSSQTGFSIHFRYVLPMFPFIFIWLGQAAALRRKKVLGKIAAGALTWTIVSSMWIYPHSLSYFNELVGGPNNGSAHLLDSNIDWGQDLLFLRDWLKGHPEARPLHLAYYGYFNPADVGFEYRIPSSLSIGSKSTGKATRLEPGWYAISIHLLRGATVPFLAGDGTWSTLSPDVRSELLKTEPIAKAGYSICIFHVSR